MSKPPPDKPVDDASKNSIEEKKGVTSPPNGQEPEEEALKAWEFPDAYDDESEKIFEEADESEKTDGPALDEEGNPYYADLMDRLFASVLDLTLILMVTIPLSNLLKKIYPGYQEAQLEFFILQQQKKPFIASMVESGFLYHYVADNIIAFLLIMSVFISFWLRKGATPGKMLLKMRVVDAKTLKPIKRWQGIVRFLAYVPAALCFMLGIFWIAWNQRRRGWHDYLSGTLVVYRVKKNKPIGLFEQFRPKNLLGIVLPKRKPPQE